MATIGEIPAIYHDTAGGIPPDVLADLTVLDATARCAASERLKASGMSHSDPVAARATLQLSCAVLREPPDAAADIRAKAAATSDPVLRRGYYALAEQQDAGGATRPSDTDRIIAEAALSTRVARQVRKLTKPGPTRTKLAATIRRQVDAATAPAQARIEALGKEIDAVTRRRAADLAAASAEPTMLFKSRTPPSAAAERYRRLAAEVADPAAARGYLELAEQAERNGR